MTGRLEALAGELEQTAGRLRSSEIEPDEAADLVERCAELAHRLGAELDREASGERGQERLL